MRRLVKGLRSLIRLAGVDVIRYRAPDETFPADFTEQHKRIIRRVGPYTMTNKERVAALCDAVNYICEAGIPGAIVECGVWKGGSMMAVALALRERHIEDRELVLFDTFEGMTPPTQYDVDVLGVPAVDSFGVDGKAGESWAPESMEGVRSAMNSTGYEPSLVRLVKGRVEDTLAEHSPDSIALLRLDTDWYESTRHELELLFPRISDGGVLIVDDYGYWKGSRRAVDEYMSSLGRKLFLHRIDDSARMIIVRH